MKIAIVHDYLFTKGGGERVVLALAKRFKAPIYTTTYLPDKTYPEFKKLKIFSQPVKFLKSPLLQTEASFKFILVTVSLIAPFNVVDNSKVEIATPPTVDLTA